MPVSWGEPHAETMARAAPIRTVLWAVVLPAAAAVSAGVGAAFSLADSEYTLTAILAAYAILMPGVALRNARVLGIGHGDQP